MDTKVENGIVHKVWETKERFDPLNVRVEKDTINGIKEENF